MPVLPISKKIVVQKIKSNQQIKISL